MSQFNTTASWQETTISFPLLIESNCRAACVYYHHTFAVHSLYAQFYKHYYLIIDLSGISYIIFTNVNTSLKVL